MALVLVQLRLAIARRGRRRDRTGAYFVFSWIVGVGFGLLSGFGTAALASAGGSSDLLLLTLYCSLLAPWLIGPLTEPTMADGVVDPARLEQFPLTSWQQVSGLLIGALVSPTASFTFLLAVGPAFGFPLPPGARLIAVLGALAFTLMCVAVSRTTQALMANSLRSRRGTDLSAIAASVVVLAFYVAAQQMQAILGTFAGRDASGPLGIALSWLPPGAVGAATILARDGHWATATLHLLLPVATTVAALLAWRWALSRRVDGDLGGHQARRGHRAGELPLIPPLLRWLPQSPGLAATAQQLRYFFFRSPKAIQNLVVPPVVGVLIARTSLADQGLTAQLTAFAAMTAATGSFNAFGYDGPGFSYLVLGGAPLRKVLRGKVLAPVVYLVPLLVGFGTVQAVSQGLSWYDLAVALAAGCCVIGLGIGVGSVASVLNPSDQSRVAHRQGSFVKVLGWFLGFFASIATGGLLWWLADQALGGLRTAGVMAAATLLLTAALLRWSGRLLERDPEPILSHLDPNH